MPIDIQISDSDLNGFSDQAKATLKEAILEYSSQMIEEANRLEAGRNSTNGPPEVTRGMVSDAKIFLQRGMGSPKRNLGLKMLRIIAAVLSLAVGFMYNDTKLQNSEYLLIFIIVIAVTIFVVTISTLKE